MFYSYLKTFNRLGVKAIPMAADTGPIGGDLSHEFIILAETGESQVYADKKIFEVDENIISLIGDVFESFADYNKAIKFYEQAISVLDKLKALGEKPKFSEAEIKIQDDIAPKLKLLVDQLKFKVF